MKECDLCGGELYELDKNSTHYTAKCDWCGARFYFTHEEWEKEDES